MKLQEIYKILDEYAPFELSTEFCNIENGYDNSGIICSTEKDVKTVVFALDLSNKLVSFAKSVNADLIITHHPAIFAPIKTVKGALKDAIKQDLGIISMHLNLDVCERGIDYYMAQAFDPEDVEILLKLSSGGYGRRFKTDRTLSEILLDCKNKFATDKILCYGDQKKKIGSVATFCGSGLDDNTVLTDCDLLISSDVKHHLILNAIDSGKCLIQLSHYACENYAFKRIYGDLIKKSPLNKLKTYYFDYDELS